jgi:hypothetical protein
VTVNEIVPYCANDIGQLDSWSIHFGISLRDLRTKLASAISSASSGLAAECK